MATPWRWTVRALLAVWESPQSLVGALNLVAQRARGAVLSVRFERERWMVRLRGTGAVSLGWFVFWSSDDTPYVPVGAENEAHEFGHSVQSRWLGPLYLPIVGLPSSMRVAYAMLYLWRRGRRWANYYDGFPERQADELGHADRSLRPAP